MLNFLIILTIITSPCALPAQGEVPYSREIHVSQTGKDSNPGNRAHPFLTLRKAADAALPGDRIIVHRGIYREQVTLLRGGTSERSRISYTAAAGEKVLIKGSERITSWRPGTNGVWEADIPNERFGGFNPFAVVLSDTSAYHLGEVYLDDRPLREETSREAVAITPGSWYCWQEDGVTKIWAHFGAASPNRQIAEINMRAAAFAAGKPGIDYITFEGFTVKQVACGPASIEGEEPGAIATGGGTHWLIRHNTITDAKCVAISIGQAGHAHAESRPNAPAYSDLPVDIAAVGHHRISGNRIERCGQAAIYGLLHGTASTIDSNRIENIGGEGRFAALHPSAIRLAVVVDALIRNNVIRCAAAEGLSLGPLYQGVRLTGNVIQTSSQNCLSLYDSHGPLIVDNNEFYGPGAATGKGVTMTGTEAGVFVSNLFQDCAFTNDSLPRRPWATSNYLPHSLVIKQTIPVLPFEGKWFGNRFVNGELGRLVPGAGWVMGYNENKAGKLPVPGCPRIDAAFIGIFPLTKESVENAEGRPLTLCAGAAGPGTGGVVRVAASGVTGTELPPDRDGAGYVAWPAERVSPDAHPHPFVHPGLLHTAIDLSRIKEMVSRGTEPWKSAFTAFAAEPASSAAYVPHPAAHVERSLLSGMGKNIGNLEKDGNAAYQNALMWCITGKEAHAKKAMEILNGWSSTLKQFDGTDIELGAGINGLKFANAAELLRATYPAWREEDIRACQAMLLNLFYPPIQYFALWAHGNWDLACMKAVMAIGIFCDNHRLFDRAVDFFYRGPGNGSLTHYVVNDSGQVQESGRDQAHTQLGIGQLAEVCQMAQSQGLDLYGAVDNRLLRGFEYVARYSLGQDVPFEPYTDQSGRFPASHISQSTRGNLRSIYEMVLNHYEQAGLPADRIKYTRMAAEKLRPEGPPFGADNPGFGTLLFSLKPLSSE